MNDTVIEALKDAGVEVEKLSEAQREVLANLSERELETLLEIKKRLGGDGEVEGYNTFVGGVLF